MSKQAPDAEQALSSTLVFEATNYDTALENYHKLKQWTLKSGLCFSNNLQGIIHHPRRLTGNNDWMVSEADAAALDWVQKMTVNYFPAVRKELAKLKLPAGARWEGDLHE